MSMVQEVGCETIFAFKYSPRPFTKAARFEGQIDEDVKSERLNRLFDMQEAMALPLVQKYVGRVMDILIETHDASRGIVTGRSSQNKLVHLVGTPDLIGQVVPVKVNQAFPAMLRGEIFKQ